MQQCIDHIGIKIKETKKQVLESPQSKSCFSPQILYSDAKTMILKPKSHRALLLLTTWQLLLIAHSKMWMDLGGYLPAHLPPATVSFIFHFSCVGLIPVSRIDTSQEDTTCLTNQVHPHFFSTSSLPGCWTHVLIGPVGMILNIFIQ